MEKLNIDFYPNDTFKKSNIFIEKSQPYFHCENGIFLYRNNNALPNIVVSHDNNTNDENISEEIKKDDVNKQVYGAKNYTLYSDLLKFFNNKYEYHELSKVTNGISRFKSNLFRHACNNLFEVSEKGVCKQIYNYSSYSQIRCPISYSLYKTGPNEDEIEGVTDGVFYLQYGSSVEEKVILIQTQTYSGGLYLEAYGTDRNLIKKMYKTIFSWMDENNFFKGKKIDCNGYFIKLDSDTWEDIVLSENMEKIIQKHLIQYVEKFDELKKKKLPTNRGFLLHGFPGSGKTLLGKVIANQINTSFIWVPHNSYHSYEEIYSFAREISPTIVFLEDLASQGGMDRRSGNVSADLGMLLNILSGIESNSGVITFATENYIDNLDTALRNRPGRFDYIMEMKLPDYNHRLKLLKKFLNEFSIERVIVLAEKTNNFSCAHLKELANRLLIEDDAPENDLIVLKEIIETFFIEQ